jgi:hypothetical protein
MPSATRQSDQTLLELSIVRIQRQVAMQTYNIVDFHHPRGLGLSPASIALVTPQPRTTAVAAKKRSLPVGASTTQRSESGRGHQCVHCGLNLSSKQNLWQHLLDTHPAAFRGKKLTELAAYERCVCRFCRDAGAPNHFLTTAERDFHSIFGCPHRIALAEPKKKRTRTRTIYTCPFSDCDWTATQKTRVASHVEYRHRNASDLKTR